MSTNQTTNYQLSQWVKSDQVKMEDFNADNAKIDEVLKAHADALAGTGNCRIEFRTVYDSEAHNQSNPLRVQFSDKPAFFILFEHLLFIMGVHGAQYSTGVVQGQYNPGMASYALSWSGNTLTVTNLTHTFSYGKYYVVAFYAQ